MWSVCALFKFVVYAKCSVSVYVSVYQVYAKCSVSVYVQCSVYWVYMKRCVSEYDKTPSFERHDSFKWEMWLISIRGMTHLLRDRIEMLAHIYRERGGKKSCRSYKWVTSLLWESRHIFDTQKHYPSRTHDTHIHFTYTETLHFTYTWYTETLHAWMSHIHFTYTWYLDTLYIRNIETLCVTYTRYTHTLHIHVICRNTTFHTLHTHRNTTHMNESHTLDTQKHYTSHTLNTHYTSHTRNV